MKPAVTLTSTRVVRFVAEAGSGGHQCYECGRKIHSGESYERAGGKCEGRWWAAAVCFECADIAAALVCGWRMYGYLWEAISEEVFPEWARVGPYDCLAKIESKEARDRLHAAFQDSLWAKA